jgi:hypothetical protein
MVSVVWCDFNIYRPPRYVGKTLTGQHCMSDCNIGSPPKCRTGWKTMELCKDTNVIATQYYTSMHKTNEPRCVSTCETAGYSYNWCFTNNQDLTEWDYCSPFEGLTIRAHKCIEPCQTFLTPIKCKAEYSFMEIFRGTQGLCSPKPDHHYRQNLGLQDRCQGILKSASSIHVEQRRRSRQSTSINFQNAFNILLLIGFSEQMNDVSLITEPNRPDITISTSTHNGVQVLHSVRARLTRATIPPRGTARPAGHPNGYLDRMRQLYQTVNDDVGHMLAVSLGGPNSLINLVPQHATTNRNLGSDDVNYSFWRATESFIQWLVLQVGTEFVDWDLFIMYEGDLDVVANRRPVGFGLRYIARFSNGTAFDSDDCTFANDMD